LASFYAPRKSIIFECRTLAVRASWERGDLGGTAKIASTSNSGRLKKVPEVAPSTESRGRKSSPTDVMSSVPNRQLFEQLQGKISALLAQSPAHDLERNLKALLAGFFSRLDLVTREEFDVQRQVLLRTREKIEGLEARVKELEQRLGK